ncbi:hypothetical protein [Phosphitispora sp. TUW77]|uniref:hypothetical protein n=1 Tax=Phosphitispora sp. TUW77 TaxID=3152361 RepID=UPI003AB11007
MLLVILIVFPFIFFLGGSYFLDYPMPLGMLYSLNIALISVVIWFVASQIMKVHTQRLEIIGSDLRLSRKQLYLSFPVIRLTELALPLEHIKEISLLSTRAGYMMTVRFDQEDKTMGVDIDINPLRVENRDIINRVLELVKGVKTDAETQKTLLEYDKKLLLWKTSYMLSFFVMGLALIIFFFISLYLGMSH